MMGFGGYGNGGSFLSPSSSSLSASAPPFTIDRSPKPGSVPLVDLLEPSYSGPMNSSLNNWLPSRAATSETNFFSNPNSELNSMSSPNNAYHFQGLQTAELSNSHTSHLSTIVSASADPFGYGQSADNVTRPYYPSCLSPTSHKDGPFVIPDQTNYDWSSTSRVAVSLDGSCTDYSQRSLDSKYGVQWGGGLWNGFAEWKQGKQGSFEGSFSSKETDGTVPPMYENYMNPEVHVLNGGGEASHGVNILNREKHGGSLNAEKLDRKAFLMKGSNTVPLDYSRSILGSISELSEIRLESPALVFSSGSADHQSAYCASSEQHVKQRANDDLSILKSSPALLVGAPVVGSSSNASGNSPFKSLNAGGEESDKDPSSNKVSSIKDPSLPLISNHKRALDSSALRIHLERDDPVSLGSLMTKNDKTSNKESITNEAFHLMSNAKCGHRIPNHSYERLNLDLNMNETVNSVQDPSEGVDHYNHAVDSPCWKGVPGSHSSPFDTSEVVQDSKKIDKYNNLNVQAKQVCQPTTGDRIVSSQKPNENTAYHEIKYQECGLALPLNKFPDANSEFGEQKSDDATEAGHQSDSKGVQHSDDNHEYGSRPDMKNMKEAGQSVSYHLPIPVQSVEDSKLHNSNEGSSTPTIDVLGLVGTIHNLSELLLFHCARGSYQLKQKDLMAVQNVINNLSACMPKNVEKMASIQVPSSEKDTLDYLGELNNLYEGFTAERPQATETAGLIQALVDAQNFHEGSKFMSGKDDGILDSFSVKADVNMADEDKATKSLKKVLTENFNEEETQAQTLLYKNLWLEAEAALCSVTYKARYNRMKIELENSMLPKPKGALENIISTDVKQPLTSLLAPNSIGVETLSPKFEGCPATKYQELSPGLSTSIQDDGVKDRFQKLRRRIENSNSSSAAIVDKPSSSAAIPRSNNVDSLLPETYEEEASPKIEISRAPSISSTNKDINDFDASVMARFHILKSRADICNPPSTEVPPLVETYCNPTSTEVQPPVETYIPRFASQRSNWPLIASISENSELGLQLHTPEVAEGQLRGSGFHTSVVDEPLAQSHPANRGENSLLTVWYDRVPSDWEHVRKEDLGSHNH